MMPMGAITDRQDQLLKAVIEEYIRTAEPVGSVNLVEKLGLKVSSATVRNEMARLVREGFLKQPHTSAGRVPTTIGYKRYLENLTEEELPVLKEVAIKQRLYQERTEPDKLFRAAALSLAEHTGCMAVITAGSGRLFSAGGVNLLDHPEFYDIDVTKIIIGMADREAELNSLIEKSVVEKEVRVLLGEELGSEKLADCGFIFSPYSGQRHSGFLGVFGPVRMNFSKIFPTIKYFKNLLNEIGFGW